MDVRVLREAGYMEALLGMSLSFYDHIVPLDEWWDEDKQARAAQRAKKLAFMQGGHNKFLESIQVWVYLQGSRDFWSEFDTYRVGTTKQSASTMHTLDKREVVEADFEEGTDSRAIAVFNHVLLDYKTGGPPIYKNISALKKNLPEGWLQERVVNTNYKVLQNIYFQRRKHRLKQWREMLDSLLSQLEHPEFIVDG